MDFGVNSLQGLHRFHGWTGGSGRGGYLLVKGLADSGIRVVACGGPCWMGRLDMVGDNGGGRRENDPQITPITLINERAAAPRGGGRELGKTLVCSEHLRRFGFDPGIIDRPFDTGPPRLPREPALAFCGFDEHGPRHLLEAAGFERVIVCGVGGTESDFDDIQIHTLPLQERTAQELWPIVQKHTYRNDLAQNNAFYRQYHEQHRCGELELAGVSVAVPFVGAIAGALVCAEVLRELNGGQRAAFIGMPLRCMEERRIRYSPSGCQLPRYAKPPLRARQHTSPR